MLAYFGIGILGDTNCKPSSGGFPHIKEGNYFTHAKETN